MSFRGTALHPGHNNDSINLTMAHAEFYFYTDRQTLGIVLVLDVEASLYFPMEGLMR